MEFEVCRTERLLYSNAHMSLSKPTFSAYMSLTHWWQNFLPDVLFLNKSNAIGLGKAYQSSYMLTTVWPSGWDWDSTMFQSLCHYIYACYEPKKERGEGLQVLVNNLDYLLVSAKYYAYHSVWGKMVTYGLWLFKDLVNWLILNFSLSVHSMIFSFL